MCGGRCGGGWLTLGDVDGEGALGDLLARKQHVDGVRPLHHGTVGAAEDGVAPVLQDELHRVLVALRVHDDHADVAVAGACEGTRNFFCPPRPFLRAVLFISESGGAAARNEIMQSEHQETEYI